MLDAAQDYLRRKGKAGAGPLESPLVPSLKCLVKYDASSVSTLAAFSVVAYGDALIDPSTDEPTRLNANRRPAFTLATPTRATAPFAITTEPIKGQTFGQAIAHGFAAVTVNVSNTGHTRARPIVGSTAKLESCASGGVPIVSRESGTGDVWAMVLLDFAETGSRADGCSSWLALPDCATLTLVEHRGSCECIDLDQTATLTKDSSGGLASEDLLYGCPPGIIDAECPDGGPGSFTMTVAGFTGDSTAFNGNWTMSYDGVVSGASQWSVTRSGVTWTLRGNAGANFRLQCSDGTYEPSYEDPSVATCCEQITLSLDDGGGASDPPATITVTPSTACGNGPSYTPYISIIDGDCGPCIRMRWIPSAGSGATSITFREVGCGEDSHGKPYIEFATASPLLCTDDAEECGENYLKVRVTCASCFVEVVCGDTTYLIPKSLCIRRLGSYDDENATLQIDHISGNTWTGTGSYTDMVRNYPTVEASLTFACVDGELVASVSMTYISEGVTYCSSTSSPVPANGDASPYVPPFAIGTYSGNPLVCVDRVWLAMAIGSECRGDEPLCDGIVDGASASLDITGGPFAGSYSGTWNDTGFVDEINATFTISGNTWTVSHSNGYWFLMVASGASIIYFGGAESYSPIVEFATPEAISYSGASSINIGDCEYSPEASYNCVNGSCVAVYDGSGEFATEAECQEACEGGGGECKPSVGDSATLHITGGAYDGDYAGVWAPVFGDHIEAAFEINASFYITVNWDEAGTIYLNAIGSGSGTEDPTYGTHECNPLLITFADVDPQIDGATGATVD